MKKRGFAIVIVLFGLSIVTALYAISSTLTLASVKRNSIDFRLAQDASMRIGLLEAVLASEPFAEPVTVVKIAGTRLELREVSGLVDLNTASRPLLELFFDNAGLSNEQLDIFLEWRSEGRRLLRVEDLRRLLETGDHIEDLHRMVTVFSGKQGVAPEAASEELLRLMRWNAGVPEPYIAPLGSIVFAVHELSEDGMPARYLGTISRSQNEAFILELR